MRVQLAIDGISFVVSNKQSITDGLGSGDNLGVQAVGCLPQRDNGIIYDCTVSAYLAIIRRLKLRHLP